MTAYVSLLRGVNLGPDSQVPMQELKQVYVDLGFASVSTYIRSGNVVFVSDDGADAVRTQIEAAVDQRFGMAVDVVVRTHGDLVDVASRNPFPQADPARLAVVFLSAPPPAELLTRLQGSDFGSDEYVADGREIYLHLPNGFGTSKLASRMSAIRGPVVGTVRNWRTLDRLIDMSRWAVPPSRA